MYPAQDHLNSEAPVPSGLAHWSDMYPAQDHLYSEAPVPSGLAHWSDMYPAQDQSRAVAQWTEIYRQDPTSLRVH